MHRKFPKNIFSPKAEFPVKSLNVQVALNCNRWKESSKACEYLMNIDKESNSLVMLPPASYRRLSAIVQRQKMSITFERT